MSITFRPSLTLDEIKWIIQSCRWEDDEQPELLRKLEVFTLKAQHGITKGSHVRAGKQTKAAQLGFEEDKSMEALLQAWHTAEDLLSAEQLQRVNHHRYLNDMMTPTEEAQYEQTQL